VYQEKTSEAAIHVTAAKKLPGEIHRQDETKQQFPTGMAVALERSDSPIGLAA